jgi:hypothetical protein
VAAGGSFGVLILDVVAELDLSAIERPLQAKITAESGRTHPG